MNDTGPITFDDLPQHKDHEKWEAPGEGIPKIGDPVPLRGPIARVKCVSAFWLTENVIMKARMDDLLGADGKQLLYKQHPNCGTVLFFVDFAPSPPSNPTEPTSNRHE